MSRGEENKSRKKGRTEGRKYGSRERRQELKKKRWKQGREKRKNIWKQCSKREIYGCKGGKMGVRNDIWKPARTD